ncbi:MAG: glucosamine-6-phosphate deaminase [Treponema sp.]|jgi:glucosamine-6-phosphate deaminase|nr:glucosamine-6-phosphate deaminase [Treponema sp.]
METFRKDLLIIKRFPTREQLGEAAAAGVSAAIKKLLETKENIRMIFAAAPSQNEFLAALSGDRSVDFGRITAFHMDEYVGLPAEAPQGFGNFLRDRLFSKCPFKEVHYLNGLAADIEEECRRYAELLNREPVDLVCMGIGENAHIAFNDPGVADFRDPKTVKPVPLDLVCRRQQVNDGCFARLEEVPARALTLTVPALFKGGRIFCMVPAKSKADAVYYSLDRDIGEKYPASILRNHASAVMYLDSDSGARLAELRGLKTEVSDETA